jgi:hypothetical protein
MREHYATNRARLKRARMFAAMRAAKERKRLERAFAEPADVDISHAYKPGRIRSGFRVTIRCLDDGACVGFMAARTPYGLTVSPTAAGRKVACVLGNYAPANAHHAA